MSKVLRNITVNNKLGLHARPSASVVKTAASFNSDIFITNERGDTVNGKSILGLMMLSAGQGSKLTISAEGNDAHAAIYAISNLFEKNFHEE